MANITRIDPFAELASFLPLVSTDDFFKGFRMRPWLDEAAVEPRIKLDVAESDKVKVQ